MFKALKSRFQQGYRTIGFPVKEPVLPDRFRGRPVFDVSKCSSNCRDCEDSCPVDAIAFDNGKPHLDMGKCLFCTSCSDACSQKAISLSKEYRLASRTRQDLVISDNEVKLAAALDEKSKKLFGRSLKLRQVSAGGCNACEADTNVLTTVVFDLGRFGIQFVASPRHADGLLITGPVTQNMLIALKKTYNAVPAPKIVIAVGACAINGGPYIGHPQANNGADSVLPVDLYIPGCPPHPITILDGLLRLLDRI
jgi:Ni,Fe-hydrogenase III small subunit/Pyruvate/2-oxoacid:ferredoxin oxidoreductase delta subunit